MVNVTIYTSTMDPLFPLLWSPNSYCTSLQKNQPRQANDRGKSSCCCRSQLRPYIGHPGVVRDIQKVLFSPKISRENPCFSVDSGVDVGLLRGYLCWHSAWAEGCTEVNQPNIDASRHQTLVFRPHPSSFPTPSKSSKIPGINIHKSPSGS